MYLKRHSHYRISTTANPVVVPTTNLQNTPTEEIILNRCTARKFDAVSIIRGEMWIFVGKYFWRIGKNDSFQSIPEQPAEIRSFWYGLPLELLEDDNLVVNAVFERSDHKIIFFIGKFYYILSGNTHLEDGPLPLTYLGLPSTLERLDGAMRWGWNDKIYFFSGDCSKIYILKPKMRWIKLLQTYNSYSIVFLW